MFAGGLVLMLFSGRSGEEIRTRVWAAAGSTGVLLLVLGFATVLDRLEGERASHQARDAATGQFQIAASRATRDLRDDAAVIQNLATFVESEPDFKDAAFQRYAEKIWQLHPNILSLRLARDAKNSHVSPPDPAAIGIDLGRTPADPTIIDQSIATGQSFIAGPVRVAGIDDVFIYRRPIFLDTGSSRDRFWDFATIFIARDAVVCAFGVCDNASKYRHALRLVLGQTPQPPFYGEAALFEPDSGAA